MPLLKLWERAPEVVLEYSVKQVVSIAGDGRLRDASLCSTELRAYLRQIDEAKLLDYAAECLAQSFADSGLALQDIVNEIGRRLGFVVENGRYRGGSGANGADGVWRQPGGLETIVEIKTTDAYRINLERLAAYRADLIRAKRVGSDTALLIVVGRQDIGDLEAQIRGSRHAWDLRILSIDALAKLIAIKSRDAGTALIARLCGLLKPFDPTNLDGMVRFMASMVEASKPASTERPPAFEPAAPALRRGLCEPASRLVLEGLRRHALSVLAAREQAVLLHQKRSRYASEDRALRVVCLASKRHPSGGYRFALYPDQKDFITLASKGYLLLAGEGWPQAYALPREAVIELIASWSRFRIANRLFWRIELRPASTPAPHPLLSGAGGLDLGPFAVALA